MAQPSNNEQVDVKLKKLNEYEVTLNVKLHITKQFKIRIFVATKLIILASFILGCRIKIEEE